MKKLFKKITRFFDILADEFDEVVDVRTALLIIFLYVSRTHPLLIGLIWLLLLVCLALHIIERYTAKEVVPEEEKYCCCCGAPIEDNGGSVK